jgi:thiamine-phosphate pyrophosphorylase
MSLPSDLKERLHKARLYLVTDQELSSGRTTTSVVEQALKGGVDLVQLREYSMTDWELLEVARELRRLTLHYKKLFIINNRPDVARLVEADGVHLGQDDLPVEEARKILGPGKIVGVSTHETGQAQKALADGADYIGVGPVYRTQTKKNVVPPVTLDYVKEVRALDLPIPFFAIGGIKPHNAGEVLAAGAGRLAVVTAIVGAPDVRQSVLEFKALLEKYPLK